MRITSSLQLLVVGFLLLPGFAGAQSRALVNANESGNRALNAGRYEAALKSYEKTLKLSEDAGDTQYQAIAMYGLARANAQLCRATIAEKWFQDSISLRESIPDDPRRAFLTQNLIEYARFLISRDRPKEAIPYFERAVPMLEDMNIEQMDPIGYANLLDDLVAVQVAVGLIEESKRHALRAAELQQRYPGREPGFRPVPYPVSCATN